MKSATSRVFVGWRRGWTIPPFHRSKLSPCPVLSIVFKAEEEGRRIMPSREQQKGVIPQVCEESPLFIFQLGIIGVSFRSQPQKKGMTL
jgi:hypothetical protein